MKMKINRFVVCILMSAVGIAWANDVSEGSFAFLRGDYKLALKKFQSREAVNDKSAQWFLGLMHEKGLGTTQNYAEAVRWYRLSAQQNDSNSQVSLGEMYEAGRGVQQDKVKAHMWFNIATQNNGTSAGQKMNDVAKWMRQEEIERAQMMANQCVQRDLRGCT